MAAASEAAVGVLGGVGAGHIAMAVKDDDDTGANEGAKDGCFVAGTLIALLGADAEAIENIRVGDRVRTTQRGILEVGMS